MAVAGARAPLPYDFGGRSTTFRGELVTLYSLRSLAFNLETSAWRALGLYFLDDNCVLSCCVTNTVVVEFSHAPGGDDPPSLRSLRPGNRLGLDSAPTRQCAGS